MTKAQIYFVDVDGENRVAIVPESTVIYGANSIEFRRDEMVRLILPWHRVLGIEIIPEV